MDIEGLINDRGREQSMHLDPNPFGLPARGPSTSGSTATVDRNDVATLGHFGFPTVNATLPDHPDYFGSVHSRKRSSHDVMADDATSAPAGGGRRPSPPGQKRSNPRSGDVGTKLSSAKDYPRRRALQACQVCRARKTKCDNERPTCGSCEALGVECSYNDAPASKYSNQFDNFCGLTR